MRKILFLFILSMFPLVLFSQYCPGSILWSDDFENGFGSNWWYFNGLWHTTTACRASDPGHSLPTVAYSSDDAICQYNDYDIDWIETYFDATAISPPLYMGFRYLLETEPGWDTGTVELTPDLGSTWYLIDSGSSGSQAYGIPGGGLDDSGTAWGSAVYDISQYAGNELLIDFGIYADSLYSNYMGYMVDDFMLFQEANLIGDLDGDGQITAYDAFLILSIVVGRITPTSMQLCTGDTDGNGIVMAFDASYLLACTVGLCDGLPSSFQTACSIAGNCGGKEGYFIGNFIQNAGLPDPAWTGYINSAQTMQVANHAIQADGPMGDPIVYLTPSYYLGQFPHNVPLTTPVSILQGQPFSFNYTITYQSGGADVMQGSYNYSGTALTNENLTGNLSLTMTAIDPSWSVLEGTFGFAFNLGITSNDSLEGAAIQDMAATSDTPDCTDWQGYWNSLWEVNTNGSEITGFFLDLSQQGWGITYFNCLNGYVIALPFDLDLASIGLSPIPIIPGMGFSVPVTYTYTSGGNPVLQVDYLIGGYIAEDGYVFGRLIMDVIDLTGGSFDVYEGHFEYDYKTGIATPTTAALKMVSKDLSLGKNIKIFKGDFKAVPLERETTKK